MPVPKRYLALSNINSFSFSLNGLQNMKYISKIPKCTIISIHHAVVSVIVTYHYHRKKLDMCDYSLYVNYCISTMYNGKLDLILMVQSHPG